MNYKCPHCSSGRLITDALLSIQREKFLYGLFCLDCMREFTEDHVRLWKVVGEIENGNQHVS